jgi:hypothetical protein
LLLLHCFFIASSSSSLLLLLHCLFFFIASSSSFLLLLLLLLLPCKARLERGDYRGSWATFEADVRQLFLNCRLYNDAPGNALVAAADHLELALMDALHKLPAIMLVTCAPPSE